MRWSVLFLVLLLGQCVRSSATHDLTPIGAAAITIHVRPVALYPGDPERREVGGLSYLGGWQLQSDNPSFGGLSPLNVEGNAVTALSDAGGLVRFRIGRFGHVSAATIMPVPDGCGGGFAKTGRDTESLAHDAATGHWWIGFEARNVICQTNADFSIGERVAQPPQMAGWSRTRGPETMVRLRDGRFLVIAEGSPDGGRLSPAVLFIGDPTDPATPRGGLSYLPPPGFSPTDAAELSDGRILILNRSFGPLSLFTACITVVDPRTLKGSAVITGPVVARFESPTLSENFEGIAAETENGRTVLWIVSDDNFASWQRTLLLKFALNQPGR
ncbi:esterase-like activity of phytase family protein [Sphingomonas sp.]|uniref:esterase-like activity of phytase family protein n=1 Tax=Sphingomonas sp. TaxID=28214 RepID=UPI0025FB9F06|nr:esterase-like activity of phytase family protein [Sphingomonas sp.]